MRGVAGVVGCNNPKITQREGHLAMVNELIKNDVLVVQTGCSAHLTCAKAGLLRPEAASEYAGKGLQEVCEAVGIPPVLHSAPAWTTARILIACSQHGARRAGWATTSATCRWPARRRSG